MKIDPAVYYSAAKSCYSLADDLGRAVDPLSTALAGSDGMAGDYGAARTWGTDYDKHSADFLTAATTFVNAIQNFGDILTAAGSNYATSEYNADRNPAKGTAPTRPWEIPTSPRYGAEMPVAMPPSVIGKNSTGIDTKIPDLLEQVQAKIAGGQVPDGDTVKLGRVADAWKKFAGDPALTGAGKRIADIAATFDDLDGPELDTVADYFWTLTQGSDAITQTATGIAGPVGAHSVALGQMRSDINTKTTALLAIGVGIAVGIVLVAIFAPEALPATAEGVTAAVEAGAETIAGFIGTFFTALAAAGLAAVEEITVTAELGAIATLAIATVAADGMVTAMAKGGRQNVGDTGIENEMRDLISRGQAAHECDALGQLMDAATAAKDNSRRQRIKATQKKYGCRWSGQQK